MKKLLAVGVIVLFLGPAIAPSINANVSKVSIESEMVEITTEICGINGVKPNTVSLSKEDAEEVDALFDSIRERLNATETREEAEQIFNEAVVELDKYGLLGGLSIKQAQRLIIKQENWLKRLYSENNNSFNLVFGAVNDTWMFGFEINPIAILGYLILEQADRTFFQTIGAYLWFYSQLKPVRFLNIFTFINFDDHDIDSIYSLGLLGLKKHIIHPDGVFLIPYFSGIIIKYNYYPPWYYQNLIFFGTSFKLISGP